MPAKVLAAPLPHFFALLRSSATFLITCVLMEEKSEFNWVAVISITFFLPAATNETVDKLHKPIKMTIVLINGIFFNIITTYHILIFKILLIIIYLLTIYII